MRLRRTLLLERGFRAACLLRVMFFDLRQKVRLGPLATLHPLTLRQRFGLLTLFPWHRLLRFTVAGIVVCTPHIISFLEGYHLCLQSSNTFLHLFYVGGSRRWRRPQVTHGRATRPVQRTDP